MDTWIEIIAAAFIFGGGAAFLLAISPIGRAVADRIRGKGLSSGGERIVHLQESHESLLEMPLDAPRCPSMPLAAPVHLCLSATVCPPF